MESSHGAISSNTVTNESTSLQQQRHDDTSTTTTTTTTTSTTEHATAAIGLIETCESRRVPTMTSPLQTLLEQGHFPTYKNQAESMIVGDLPSTASSSSSIRLPMAVATNIVWNVDDDDETDQASCAIPLARHTVVDEEDVIVTRNTSSSIQPTSSTMDRRLDDYYRQCVVASYERHATLDDGIIMASTSRNEFPGIEIERTHVKGAGGGYVPCRRRMWWGLVVGIATVTTAVVTTSFLRNNARSNVMNDADDEAQQHPPSMMDVWSENDDAIPLVEKITTIPLYDTQELYHAVDEYMQLQMEATMNEALLTFRYGYPMNQWDVSHITNFTSVFDGQRNPQLPYYFNEDLSLWDVSNATNMFRMFANLNIYTGAGLDHWNVHQVTNMRSMFHDAFVLEANLSHWQVGQVQRFDRMFADAHLFNGDISLWNTSAAESMASMVRTEKNNNNGRAVWDDTHDNRYLTQTKQLTFLFFSLR